MVLVFSYQLVFRLREKRRRTDLNCLLGASLVNEGADHGKRSSLSYAGRVSGWISTGKSVVFG